MRTVAELRAELAVNPITRPLHVGHIGVVDPYFVPNCRCVSVPRMLSPEEVAERAKPYFGIPGAVFQRVPRWVGEDTGKEARFLRVLAEWRRALGRHQHLVGPSSQDPTVLLVMVKHEPGPEMMATISRLWSTARPEGVTALRIEWTRP